MRPKSIPQAPLPAIVTRWFLATQDLIPARHPNPRELLREARSAAERTERAAREPRSPAPQRSAASQLAQEIRELALALDWLRGSEGRARGARPGQLKSFEGRLVNALCLRIEQATPDETPVLATSSAVREPGAVPPALPSEEATLLGFPQRAVSR